MMCMPGARSAFKGGYSSNSSIASSSSLTYEGLFAENFFSLKSKEEKLANNIELSTACVTNPFDNKKEHWIGVLLKSKYDGEGIKEPIDLSIAIDTSGSMSSIIESKNSKEMKNRITLAKEAIFQLVKKLDEKDNIGFTSFDTTSKVLFPMTPAKDFLNNKSFTSTINSMQAEGGTTLYQGLLGASELFTKNSSNKHKRIIFLTDMISFNEQNFLTLYKDLSLSDIYITVLGISENFNTKLQEEVAHVKGSNYYICEYSEDIQKYLVDEFNYVCFPASFDVNLEMYSSHLTVNKIIGTGFKEIKVKEDKTEWNTEQHRNMTDEFKKEVMFLMCYFKRINKVLPKPVLACICNYLKCEKKTICKLDTTFPSSLKNIDGKYYVEGGMMLLKVENELKGTKIDNGYPFMLKLKYKEPGEEKEKTQSYSYFMKEDNENSFSDNSIKKALALYYYAKHSRKIMKVFNEERKNKNKKIEKSFVFGDEHKKNNNLIFDFFDKLYINEEGIYPEKKEKYKKTLSDMIKNSENEALNNNTHIEDMFGVFSQQY